MTIKASMTAYSTAVGPSSETRKRCTFLAKFFIAFLQFPVPTSSTPFRVVRSKNTPVSRNCHRAVDPPGHRACKLRCQNLNCYKLACLILVWASITALHVVHPFGSQANDDNRSASLGFASQPCGWFAFLEDDNAAGSISAQQLSPKTSVSNRKVRRREVLQVAPAALTFCSRLTTCHSDHT